MKKRTAADKANMAYERASYVNSIPGPDIKEETDKWYSAIGVKIDNLPTEAEINSYARPVPKKDDYTEKKFADRDAKRAAKFAKKSKDEEMKKMHPLELNDFTQAIERLIGNNNLLKLYQTNAAKNRVYNTGL